MTEPSPAPEHDAAEERVHTPAPTPDTESKEPKKDTKSKKKDFPVGQVAVGGLGAVTLGSYALASVVGPIGWAAAPAAATVAGAGYVAYRRRKSRSGMERTKTTITRTRGSKSMHGGGLSGLRARGGGRSGLGSAGRAGGVSTSAKRSGGLGSSGRSGAGLGSSSARKSGLGVGSRGGAAVRRTGGGATPRTGSSGRRTPGGGGGSGLFGRGGSSPRSGGSGGGLLGRGATPRSAKGGTTPRGGGLLGRGSDTTASKRKSTPPGGSSPRTSGGSMPKSRWGGASGPTSRSTRGGRIRRSAARARDWADDKTGRRMSTGWRAARKEKGFKNRRRAAGQAVRAAGGGGVIAGAVGVIAAAFAGLANLFGWSSKDKKKTSAATEANEPTSAISSHPVYTWLADGTPFIYLIPKDLLASTDPLRFKSDTRSSPTSTSTTTPTGETTMAGLPAAQMAADMEAAMARYEPADAWEVLRDAKQWPNVPDCVAGTVKNYADQLEASRFPLNEAIVDKLWDMHEALRAVHTAAEELYPLMQKAHAVDIARRDGSRGDESKWNV